MSLVGRVFTNRYEIEREIAQGGMAEVYLARDRLLDRRVALKALFPEYAREPSFVERFRREAQAAANLNHPNIVAIYDWGQESGTYFIVMEYVEGRPLRDLIRGEGPLDPFQSAEITAEIAAALAFAHRSGVVHRDVKPGNVLITRSGTVKVTDFGIARAGTSDGLTQTGSVMGTATYFSPEQAQGLRVDGRSDVYSLGVVLYEMVTGVTPFTGDSPVAVAYKHVREDPVPPSRRNPDVPADLEQIILTALAKDPDHRYQTADDLRADLLRFRRGRPLAAAPVTALVAELPTTAAAAAAANPASAPATVQSPSVPPPPPPGPPGPPPGARPSGSRVLATALTIGVLALVVLAILLLSGALGGDDGPTIAVPEVVGLEQDEAVAALEDAGFEAEVVPEENAEVAEGIVFDQDPAPGDRAEEGSTVRVLVSAGAGAREVPDVAGDTRLDAFEILAEAGFRVELDLEASDEVAQDRVIRTEPAAGTRLEPGEVVTLVVSSGPEPIDVPEVDGLAEADAARILGDAGFAVQVLSEASDDVAAGRVIRTDPRGGDEAPPGTTVRMFVSSGSDKVEVPNVIGLLEDDARTAIEDLGLTVRRIESVSTPGNNGRVIAQQPAADSRVEPGTSVVITVGVLATPTTTAAPAPTTTNGS